MWGKKKGRAGKMRSRRCRREKKGNEGMGRNSFMVLYSEVMFLHYVRVNDRCEVVLSSYTNVT